MRRAVIAFSLAVTGVGCVADQDTIQTPHFGFRAQLPENNHPLTDTPLRTTVRPTVWSDLPLARTLVERRTVVATSEPVGMSNGELIWKAAGGNVSPPQQPAVDEPGAELPKPELMPSTDEPLTWGGAKRR